MKIIEIAYIEIAIIVACVFIVKNSNKSSQKPTVIMLLSLFIGVTWLVWPIYAIMKIFRNRPKTDKNCDSN